MMKKKLLVYHYIINSEKNEESKQFLLLHKYFEPCEEEYNLITIKELFGNSYFLTEKCFDLIFKKISKTFSQDLIAYLNHYCKKNFSIVVNKINEFYSESIHSNLNAYIKEAKKFINIVYTFSKNDKLIIKAEELLKKEIFEFYNSQNNFFIINFEESDSQKLQSLLTYLKDFEKSLKFEKKKKK